MSKNTLELKIVADSNDKKTELSALSLAEAKAFIVLIEAVTKIVELSPDNENIKIEIKEGSACVVAEGEGIAYVDNLLNDILNNKSSDNLVTPLRDLQNLFHNNSIKYEGKISIGGNSRPIYSMLKQAKKIKKAPTHRPPLETNVEFYTGTLIAVGGKIPNIHIENGGQRLLVSCTQNNANKAKHFLYKQIHISAWVRDFGSEKRYELCDSYFETQMDLFISFKEFIFSFMNAENEIESLKKIHIKSREFLDGRDYGNFKKFLRLFNHESTDINTLKTILIITQSFKEHPILGTLRNSIRLIFEKKMKTLNHSKKNKRAKIPQA